MNETPMKFREYLKIVLSPYVKRKSLDRVTQSVEDSIINIFREEIVNKIADIVKVEKKERFFE